MTVLSHRILIALWLEGLADLKNGQNNIVPSSPASRECQLKERPLGSTDNSSQCKSERRIDGCTEGDDNRTGQDRSNWLTFCAIGVVWCCSMVPVMSYSDYRDESTSFHRLLHPTAPMFALSCTIYGYALIGLYQHTRRSVFRAPLLIISILAALSLCAVQRRHVIIRPNIAVPVAVVAAMVLSRIAEGIRQTWMASSRH